MLHTLMYYYTQNFKTLKEYIELFTRYITSLENKEGTTRFKSLP